MAGAIVEPDGIARFSLLGGPLHGLGRRVGLVRGANNTVPLGLALGLGPWAVVVALALAEGLGQRIFSLSLIAAHVRLLLDIPLFFVCETWVDPRMKSFVDTIVRSEILPGAARPALDSEVARTVRWKDSWIPDALCLVAAVLWSSFGSTLALQGVTSVFDPGGNTNATSLAGRWYWFVCLPLFRFLALRWIWRLGLWVRFLRRVAQLELRLVPTHPDGAGGLGYLEVTQTHFMPLILALSALQAAGYAEEIVSRKMAFEAIYPGIALILLVDVALFIGPALVFMPRLWACRVKGLSDYMEFAATYVSGFDRKWLSGDAAHGEPLLGTSDLQSLADLANSVNIVRNMRILPVDLGLLRDFVVVALLPILPLLLLKYPVAELIQKFLERL